MMLLAVLARPARPSSIPRRGLRANGSVRSAEGTAPTGMGVAWGTGEIGGGARGGGTPS